jgi:cation transport ATPase
VVSWRGDLDAAGLASAAEAGSSHPIAHALRDHAAPAGTAHDICEELGRGNQFEEQLLQPVLLDADWLGAVRVARMVEDHAREHRAMGRQLGGASAPTAELRATLAVLRAHLDSEEHYFLTRRVLRDDLAR